MPSKAFVLSVAAVVGAGLVSAQSALDYNLIPSACATSCAQTVETSFLCNQQYADNGVDLNACFCNSFPSDASACSTCLTSNNAAAAAQLLTAGATACPTALDRCFFECSFPTCASTDVACQCSATYLQNIFECGSCNTAKGNTGATQLSDWQALDESCQNQNYTAAGQSFSTEPLPTATGQAGYVAPTLTGTGGGLAATGDLTATVSTRAAGSAVTSVSRASGTARTSTTVVSRTTSASRVASTSVSRSGSASAGAGGASVTSAGVAASSAAATGGAVGLSVPGVGGVLVFVGAVLALL